MRDDYWSVDDLGTDPYQEVLADIEREISDAAKSTGTVEKPRRSDSLDGAPLRPALVSRIALAIRDGDLTQRQAARMTGMTEGKISALLDDDLRSISVERLLRSLVDLGHDVEISISKKTKPDAGLKITHERASLEAAFETRR